MDGEIIIGTKLDTKELAKNLKEAEKDLKKYEKEAEKLTKQKIELDISAKEVDKSIAEIDTAITRMKQKMEKMEIAGLGGTKDYNKLGENVAKYEEARKILLQEVQKRYEEINYLIKANEHNQKLTNEKVAQFRNELNKSQNFDKIKKSIKDVGKGIEDNVKKISRWALAIFGLRSAISFIKNSMNIIASNDEQLKADIDYMRTAIAYSLEPLIRKIVELMKDIMFYVAYIIKAWTGKNIFANADKGAKNTAKSVAALNNELNKTIAGFDEMNTLSTQSGGIGTNVSTPSFSFGDLDNIQVPKWLSFIVNNKDKILSLLAGIVGYIGAIKIGLSGIKSLGIAVALAGIVYTIEKIIDYMNDPTFENFIGILEGIAITVLGIAIAFAAWPVALGAALALVVLVIVNHFDEIMGLYDELKQWLDTNVLGWLQNTFGKELGRILYEPLELLYTSARTWFESFFGGFKKYFEGIKKILDGDFKNGIKEVWSGVADILLAPFNALKKTIANLWNDIKGAIDYVVNKINEKFSLVKPITIGVNTNVGGAVRSALLGGLYNIFGEKGMIVLPRLETGGIINNPGRGVPIGSAIGGERGAEGVIPLTDAQQMELLGEAIGKYITINANITNTMNGRVISRELQKLQTDSNFMFNR